MFGEIDQNKNDTKQQRIRSREKERVKTRASTTKNDESSDESEERIEKMKASKKMKTGGSERKEMLEDEMNRLRALSGVYKKQTAPLPQIHHQHRPAMKNLIIPKDFCQKMSFADRFKVLDNLGEGGSCIVRKVACRTNGKICAVKSSKLNDDVSTGHIKKESKILKKLVHPNIIKSYGIFESATNVSLGKLKSRLILC